MATGVKTKSRKKKVVLIIVIVLLAVGLLTGGALAAVGLSVSNGNTIFPNVTVEGVPVGGLTIQQAAERLAAPMEAAQAERAVVVEFPGENTITVTAEEAGLVFSGYEAAQIAYQFGRSNNIFANSQTFLRGHISPIDIDPLTLFAADRGLVSAAVHEAAIEMDLLAQGMFEVVDDHLLVVKGRLVVVFDEDTVVDMIIDAFSSGARTPIHYDAESTEPEPINLALIHESLFSEPVDSVFDIELGEATEHVVGIDFDLPLAESILNAAAMGEEVLIPLIIIEPEITQEYLTAVLFRDTLAYSTTRLTGDENRNTNIHLASEEINGMILNPGDQFDFNTVVQQRTAARGFRPAGAFSGTEVIQSVGGGICQVSSTIYHALLHTDIQVDTRINHTLVVTYLPLGMDAAVAWGGPHFAFTNTTPFPLRIVIYRDGLNLHARLEGTQTSPYRIVPEGVYINSVGFPTTYRDYPGLPAGQTRVYSAGRIGHVVDVFQRFYDENNNLVRREFVMRSSYRPVPQIVLRGTGAAPTPTPAPDYPDPIPTPPADPPPPPPPPDPPPADPAVASWLPFRFRIAV